MADHINNVLTKLVHSVEEGDAHAHEEGDDDEAKTSAEGVNESEPVNSSICHQQETHQVKAETQSA